MQPLTFHAPATVDEVCELLAHHEHDAKVLAGGQSLIQMLKQRLVGAEHIIDISNLDELSGIHIEDGTLWIGATETYATVRRNEMIRDAIPILPEMIATIGDKQVRSKGTLVGGIAHADPDGDPPILASALDATIRVRCTDSHRDMSSREFYRGLYETDLHPNELVTEVGFPTFGEHTVGTYRSFTPRKGDYAVAAVALIAEVPDEGVVNNPRVTVGAISDAPKQLADVERELEGTNITEDTVARAAAIARDSIDPHGDAEFGTEHKASLVETLLAEAGRAVVLK